MRSRRALTFLVLIHGSMYCSILVSSLVPVSRRRRPQQWLLGRNQRVWFATSGNGKDDNIQKTIAVIGGGASGIFSAIACAERLSQITSSTTAHKVIVLEATNKTLRKVKISGGGRCNVLHDTHKSVPELLQGYPRGRRELNGILHKRFSPTDAREWFETRGVELKTEVDGRMFPTTDSSQTIIDTLLRAAREAKVQIRYRHKAHSVETVAQHPRFCVQVESKEQQSTNTETLLFDAAILATGSTPFGYRIAETLGHSIVPTVPSLFTLNVAKDEMQQDGLLHELAGVSVPWARVSFRTPLETTTRKVPPQLTNEGPLLVTHHGLSGPAILRLSSFGARELAQHQYQGMLRVQWAPHLGAEQEVFDQLWQTTQHRPKKQVASVCPLAAEDGSTAAIPKRLWAALVYKRAGFEDGQTWGTASKKLVRKLATQVCACDIAVAGKGTFKEEFVTAGGVALKELDMRTMQSKTQPGLFFCGELINVDGVTGGYNFLNCWSTGFVAGTSAAEYVAAEAEQRQEENVEQQWSSNATT